MVRHDEQGDAIAHMRPKTLDQRIDLAFEARRDIVHGSEQKPGIRRDHARPCAPAAAGAPPLARCIKKASLEINRPYRLRSGQCGSSTSAHSMRPAAEVCGPMSMQNCAPRRDSVTR